MSNGVSGWPPIPSWEVNQLQSLASSNQLYGVDPLYLAVIVQEESAGVGGGINPSGYGGFFGLGANDTYPGGTVSTATLQSTSQQSFTQQAQIAASAFASYLQGAGGNPVAAEQYYQTGSYSGKQSSGAALMSQYTSGLAPIAAYTTAATTSSSGGIPAGSLSPFGVPTTVPSAPSFGYDPLSDLGSAFVWLGQFSAWAVFTTLVFVVGTALLLTGVTMFGVVLLGPVTGPVLQTVGGKTPVGRATKAGARRLRSPAGSSSGAGPPPPTPEEMETGTFERGRTEGRHQAIRSAGRETGRREITGARRQAMEQRERQEGFPSDYEPPRPLSKSYGQRRQERTMASDEARRAKRREAERRRRAFKKTGRSR
jgi:hypothetical protein